MGFVSENSSGAIDPQCSRATIFTIMEHLVSLTSRWFAELEPRVRDNVELRAAFDLAKESRRVPVGLAALYRVYCTTRTLAVLLGIAELYCSDAVPEIIRALTTPLF